MTNQQGAPVALRLAEEMEHDPTINRPSVVAELRRLHAENTALQQGYDAARLEIDSLHARVQELGAMLRENCNRRIVELEAQLEAIGAGGVENASLRASPTPPALSAAPAEQEEAAQRLRKTLDIDPGDVNDPLHPRYIAGFKSGHAAGRRRAAPAASPTPPAEQQAPKAAQEEMDKEASNARLDIDSNSTEPEQQRDVACSLEVGQHVGNGEHQEASCRGSKDSELLKIAARNLKYFIAHAQFSSFADKQAALNCIDILAAPQQEAQEPVAYVHVPHYTVEGKVRPVVSFEKYQQDYDDGIYSTRIPLYTAPQPAPAPLSDDAVRDAARYRWLRENWFTMTSIYQRCITFKVGEPRWSDITEEELDAAIDAALAAQGGK